jgi:hypothetical protein
MIHRHGRRWFPLRNRVNPSRSKQHQSRRGLLLLLVMAVMGATNCRPHAPAQNPGDARLPASKPVTLAFTCTTGSCSSISPPDRPTGPGIFEQGAIDLTGNGIPELVRRHGTVLVVHEMNPDGEYHEVWQSPEAWRVVDAALGDPNDNGRYEMMVAFWKDDAGGIPRSHPFIVGYREGSYREVWGGSPIAEPIYELALADVDGDGLEDLIVLDAAPGTEDDAMRNVSVWRWHGWGFSLMWRSEPALYRDLVVLPDIDAPAIIVVSTAP